MIGKFFKHFAPSLDSLRLTGGLIHDCKWILSKVCKWAWIERIVGRPRMTVERGSFLLWCCSLVCTGDFNLFVSCALVRPSEGQRWRERRENERERECVCVFERDRDRVGEREVPEACVCECLERLFEKISRIKIQRLDLPIKITVGVP
jgi:hypothetical protein